MNFGIHFPSQQVSLPINICSVKLHIITVSEFCFCVFPVGRYYWKNSLAKLSNRAYNAHGIWTPALVIWGTVYTGMSKCQTLKIQSAPKTAEWEVAAEQMIRAPPCCCQRLEGRLATAAVQVMHVVLPHLLDIARDSVAKSRCLLCLVFDVVGLICGQRSSQYLCSIRIKL